MSSLAARLPFYYGWVVGVVAFVTVAVGVNTRTSFSLLYPAILDEYGWARGETAGIFAFGFATSLAVTPFIGVIMERWGPRLAIPFGAVLVAAGLALATRVTSLLGLYVTLGAMTVGGSVFLSFIGHSAFLPHWFVRRRGLALGLIFSGVGVGGVILFPLLARYIESAGWREACLGLALLMLVTIVPLNAAAQRRRPEDLGLRPDGGRAPVSESVSEPVSEVAERSAALGLIEGGWRYRAIFAEPRFWALAAAYFCSLYNFYCVQVHQTRFFIEAGFGPEHAALALGLVGFIGIAGQITIGAGSDRIGREWAWSLAMLGYVGAFVILFVLSRVPELALVYAFAGVLGILGAGTTPLFAAIAADIFAGPGFGRVFGLLSAASALGAGVGAYATGLVYDGFASYDPAFVLGIGFAGLSAGLVWLANPSRGRALPPREPQGGR